VEKQPVFVIYKSSTRQSPGEAGIFVDAYSAGSYDGDLAVLVSAIKNSALIGGIVITTVKIDNSNGGAVLVSRRLEGGIDLHGVNKLVLSRDYMYNVFTALQPSAANDERLRMEINGILNSFQTLDARRE
jgi:hypothetical protein